MKIDQIRDDSISCDICGEERPSQDEYVFRCGECEREGLDCCVSGPDARCNDCEDIAQQNYDEEYEYDEDDFDEDVDEDLDEEEL